jgi:hypothetical protein
MTKLVVLLAFFCLVLNINCENVKVQFMDYTSSEWSAIESSVKTVIASKLNDYCKANDDCGVTRTNSDNISATDLKFAGNKDSFTIDGRFAVVYISAIVENQAITGTILEAFMKEKRQSIVDDSGAAIAYINDELVFPARDNTDNYVIISISSTVVLGLFILNIVLTKKREKKELQILKDMATQASTPKDKSIKVNGSTEVEKKSSKLEENNKSPRKAIYSKPEETMPLNPVEDEDLVPSFPKANEKPILSTSESMYNGIKMNPNMRLTQV